MVQLAVSRWEAKTVPSVISLCRRRDPAGNEKSYYLIIPHQRSHLCLSSAPHRKPIPTDLEPLHIWNILKQSELTKASNRINRA